MEQLRQLDHPLIQHKLGRLRDKRTEPCDFRRLVREIALLMAYEVTRELDVVDSKVETPVGPARTKMLDTGVCVVPILRAGLGMVDGVLQLVPEAAVGHIGVERDETTHRPREYYCKLPRDIGERSVIVVDPMLATGGSACAALTAVKGRTPERLFMMAIIAAPEGVGEVHRQHPDVPVYTAAVDDHLDENAYIVPGLGDAGDRMFATVD